MEVGPCGKSVWQEVVNPFSKRTHSRESFKMEAKNGRANIAFSLREMALASSTSGLSPSNSNLFFFIFVKRGGVPFYIHSFLPVGPYAHPYIVPIQSCIFPKFQSLSLILSYRINAEKFGVIQVRF